jgi:hypothetical protein
VHFIGRCLPTGDVFLNSKEDSQAAEPYLVVAGRGAQQQAEQQKSCHALFITYPRCSFAGWWLAAAVIMAYKCYTSHVMVNQCCQRSFKSHNRRRLSALNVVRHQHVIIC